MDLTRRRFLECVTAVGATATIAGCGSGDGAGSDPTATATPSPVDEEVRTPESETTPTPTPESGTSAQERYPGYEWSQLDGATPTETTEVTLENFAYHPLIATVSPGTTVTFVNEDSAGHTVTIPKLDVDETISGGESATVTFEEPGTYDYVCTFHGPSMLGRVVVSDGMDTATPTPASQAPTVRVREDPDHGEILTDADGMTLYVFDRDTRGEGTSACAGDCAGAWPPLTVDGEPTAGEGVTADLTTFEREDGSTQVAANGWPLYYFASDERPGEAKGQGVGDAWWIIRPDGTPVRASQTATPTQTGESTPTERGGDGSTPTTSGGGMY